MNSYLPFYKSLFWSVVIGAWAVVADGGTNTNPAIPITSVFGLAVFVLDIIAICKISQSRDSTPYLLCWVLMILFFPVGGLILWCMMGPAPPEFAYALGRKRAEIPNPSYGADETASLMGQRSYQTD